VWDGDATHVSDVFMSAGGSCGFGWHIPAVALSQGSILWGW